MKVWRNSEGLQYPVGPDECAIVGAQQCWAGTMEALGYELVGSEPEEFEVGCVDGIKTINCKGESQVLGRILDGRLIPGKTYLVREKV